MALTTRVWSAGKLLVLAGALVATYVLFAVASMRLALRASEVPVPDFTNRTANEATSAAGRSRAGPQSGRRQTDRPEGGRGADPRAGTAARVDRPPASGP